MKNYPRVTEILKASGFYSPFCSEAGMERGSIVHETLKYLDNGTLKTFDPQISGYIEAYEKAKSVNKWMRDILFNETSVKSNLWGYRGTFDRLFTNKFLLDIKTGGKNEATGLQLSAYKQGIAETLKIKVKECYGLYLQENGKYHLEPYNKSEYWQDFVTCLKHFKMKERRKLC